MDWLTLAKSLPVGGRRRVACCRREKTALVSRSTDGFRHHCFSRSCDQQLFVQDRGRTLSQILSARETVKRVADENWTLPSDMSLDIKRFPLEAKVWIYKASITEAQRRQFMIGWSDRLQRVVLPLEPLEYMEDGTPWTEHWTARAVMQGQKPKYMPRPVVPWYSGNWHGSPLSPSPVVVCEDILSAIRLSPFLPSFALHGTMLPRNPSLFTSTPQETLLWLDGDRAGKNALPDLRRKFSLLGKDVRVVSQPGDPKDYSRDEIAEILEEAWPLT